MKFDRRFAPAGEPALACIQWESRTALITEPDGRVVFEQKDVEVPAFWSQTATDVLAQKYFRKAGVPNVASPRPEQGMPLWIEPRVPSRTAVFGGETSARQVFHRLAGCWTYWGWKSGVFDGEASARNFYEDVCWLLAHQMMAPNSPQWFNSGLWWAYGITGPPQGMHYVDPADGKLKETANAYERTLSHACFLLSLKDDLISPGGIMDLWTREARIFKMGGGAGSNVSNLRGEGELLSGGGRASGPMSFLKTGDSSAGAIKSGGTTRRAALLRSMNIDHPDVEQFITLKRDEETKVAAIAIGSAILRREAEEIRHKGRQAVLGASLAGLPNRVIKNLVGFYKERGKNETWLPKEYDLDWRSEAYQTVTGQNANNSVRLSNEFMQAVDDDAEWKLRWRTTGTVAKKVQARKLWDQINVCAWQCADPGVQFDCTINEWNPIPECGRINSANPCAEYNSVDDTACNLLSHNLIRFLNDDGVFDVQSFVAATEIGAVVLEITVAMAQLPSPEIAVNTYRQRQLGLGYANLGTLLMAMGAPYDSDKGRAIAAAVTCIQHCTVGATSARMAEALGPFLDYEKCRDSFLRVMRNHRAATYPAETHPYEKLAIEPPRIDPEVCPRYLLAAARLQAEAMVLLGEKHGYRNAQFSVQAPTGTISLVMDCDTTGVEPAFSLVTYKSLAGGGTIVLANQSVGMVLRRLKYTEDRISAIVEKVKKTGFMDPQDVHPEHLAIFDAAMSKTRPISPEGHVKMLAAIQPFISGASSKTLNVPEDWLVEDFKSFHRLGWSLGVKAMAAYRNGSKLSQPLESFDATMEIEEGEVESVEVLDKSDTSPCHDPLAQFDKEGRHALDPNLRRRRLPDRRRGYTQKVRIGETKIYLRTGEYDNGDLGEIFVDLHKEGATFRSVMSMFSVAVSIALQHGTPLEAFVERFCFTRFEPAGLVRGHKHIKTATSLFDFIFRELAVSYLGRHDLAEVPMVPADLDGTSTRDEVLKELQAGQPRLNTLDGFTASSSKWDESLAAARKFQGMEATPPSPAKKRAAPTGECCATCGNFSLTRIGPCLRCDKCGTTTGCG